MEFTSKVRSRMVIKAIAPFISNSSKVLDIGCGNGVISHEVQKFFNCKLIGTDILEYSEKNIIFKKMLKDDKLDFNNNEFDIGLFIEVLHHMPFETQLKLIKDALRICPKVLIFEVESTLLAKGADYLVNQLHNREMNIPFTFRKKNEWLRLFEENNIRCESYGVTKPHLLRFFWPFTYHLFCLKKG